MTGPGLTPKPSAECPSTYTEGTPLNVCSPSHRLQRIVTRQPGTAA